MFEDMIYKTLNYTQAVEMNKVNEYEVFNISHL